MEPFKLSKTNTTRLLLPMVVKDNVDFHKVIEQGFINSYLIDATKFEYMLLDENIIIARTHYVDNHYNNKLYTEVTDIYIDDSTHLFVHKIDERWIKDYYNIISGQYKDLSEEYKKHLLSFWNLTDESFLNYLLTNDQEKIHEYFSKYRNKMSHIKEKNKEINNIIPFDIAKEGYKLFELLDEAPADENTTKTVEE